jgi:hypothetical protein
MCVTSKLGAIPCVLDGNEEKSVGVRGSAYFIFRQGAYVILL